MAAAVVDSLSGDLASKAQIDAISRDYILEPRLGEASLLRFTTYLPANRGDKTCRGASTLVHVAVLPEEGT